MAIFIGGYARTGTTLMQAILCSDSSTFPFTKESIYLYSLVYSYIEGRQLWNLHVDDYFDSLEDYVNFNKNIIAEYIYHIKDRWGWDKEIIQKSPLMTTIFPELSYLMNGIEPAKFIVMLRDPRDTIASMKSIYIRLNKKNYNRGIIDGI
ncbi:sulfotransferase [Cyanobacterium aponinum]|uniref:sulfotransferase n=1 Tax=Cyanobacterium aponinum TaxID=379064 RepID=UPI000C12C12F|nr:sulfotransferase [Cyanobacterium aponinum]PHV62810.1 hypothetical protein CSQ80_08835 [Cyanobacterium aponinum IPPAS B-1201]